MSDDAKITIETESEKGGKTIKEWNTCKGGRCGMAACGGIGGPFWFFGWLFTIAFAKLSVWPAILGIIIWPYYLGQVVRK